MGILWYCTLFLCFRIPRTLILYHKTCRSGSQHYSHILCWSLTPFHCSLCTIFPSQMLSAVVLILSLLQTIKVKIFGVLVAEHGKTVLHLFSRILNGQHHSITPSSLVVTNKYYKKVISYLTLCPRVIVELAVTMQCCIVFCWPDTRGRIERTIETVGLWSR